MPCPVQNLTASLDTSTPSVTLNWEPPANASDEQDITKYQICLWDEEKDFCNETVVNGSTTTSVITRESGLRPLTTFTFKVRAYSGDDVSREWRTVSRFIGNQIC